MSNHHTHIWSLDGEHHVVSTHVVVDQETSPEEALQTKRNVKYLLDPLHLEHITVQIEYENEECRVGKG